MTKLPDVCCMPCLFQTVWPANYEETWSWGPVDFFKVGGSWTCSGNNQYFSNNPGALPNAACGSSSGGKELTDASGWVSSGGSADAGALNGYPAKSTCMWTIKADNGKQVKLQFEALDTEADYDKVYVTRGLDGAGGDSRDAVFSGSPQQLPPPITIPVEDKGACVPPHHHAACSSSRCCMRSSTSGRPLLADSVLCPASNRWRLHQV